MRTLCIILFFVPLIACSQLTGRVVGITDGDTFTLLDSSKNQITIRLHGIDCPERHQPFSNTSKKYLTQLIYLKQVKIRSSGKDRYGRTVGIVWLDHRVINEKMIEAGMAWHYKKYDTRKEWAKLEERARRLRIGLWQDDNPVPPWEWRHTKKKRKNL